MSQKKRGNIVSINKRKSGIGKVIALCFLVIALILFAGGAWSYYQYVEHTAELNRKRAVVEHDRFYDNITIDGIDVSGMTFYEALDAVNARNASIADGMKLEFAFEGQRWAVDASMVGVRFNTQSVVSEAYSLCREGDLQQRYDAVQSLSAEGAAFQTEMTYDLMPVRSLAARIDEALYIEPVDAQVDKFDPGTRTFTFTAEKEGREGLAAEALDEALGRFEQMNFPDAPIQVKAQTLKPAVTKAQLEESNRLLASASTTAKKDKNRNSNISLAMAAFNNYMVPPGEVFSFNETTGKRSADKGYLEAGTIKNGKLIPEFGGGVCQVSTTLFNAVAKAGLEIVERNAHSWPSSYVDIGKDAMVDYPGSDFKFRNNTSGPIFLITRFSEQKLTVEIYGTSLLDKGVTIQLRSVTTETIPMPDTVMQKDMTLAPGEEETEREGHKGYRAITYQDFYRDGAVIDTKELFKSYYRPIAPIIRYNPTPAVNPITGAPIVTQTQE